MIKTKKTKKLLVLLVIILLGIMVKGALGATFPLPLSQLNISEEELTCPNSNSPYLMYNFGNIEAHEVLLSGDIRYFTIWLKNLPSNTSTVQMFSFTYRLDGGYPNTSLYTMIPIDATEAVGLSSCTPFSIDLGSTLTFTNGSFVAYIGVFDTSNHRLGDYSICGTHSRPVNMGYIYQGYHYLASGVCNSGSNYLDWEGWQYQFFPAYSTTLYIPPPDIAGVNITITEEGVPILTGNIINNVFYDYIFTDIYNISGGLIEHDNTYDSIINDTFSATLSNLPIGEYQARFRLYNYTRLPLVITATTTYDFTLTRVAPPVIIDEGGTNYIPRDTYIPESPVVFYNYNSTYTTPTALYTNITGAIYPVIKSIGNWSVSFNASFDTTGASDKGNSIGLGIATVRGYATNLNGFFGDLPVSEALGIYIILQLALAVLASIRFIIKLIK